MPTPGEVTSRDKTILGAFFSRTVRSLKSEIGPTLKVLDPRLLEILLELRIKANDIIRPRLDLKQSIRRPISITFHEGVQLDSILCRFSKVDLYTSRTSRGGYRRDPLRYMYIFQFSQGTVP